MEQISAHIIYGMACYEEKGAAPDHLREDCMASILVRRDQFNITPQGIVHKPTDPANQQSSRLCHARRSSIKLHIGNDGRGHRQQAFYLSVAVQGILCRPQNPVPAAASQRVAASGLYKTSLMAL